ncbi:putative bifunctional diguanylate cyclase/phosphodiesterase [Kineococcus sp. SYSU DK006]|uniref:putative bifunctional diguanylate cyclase/phosphodiesterase n=1 Tax=Kineococcus sp. SYSU DK006 TaxID=3383127 RepID=UPI003D7E5F22
MASTALLLPPARLVLLLVSNWLAVALVVLGIAHHRPQRRLVWVLVTAFVTLVALCNTTLALTGGDDPVTTAATFASQAAAALAMPLLLGAGSGTRWRAPRPSSALELCVHVLVVAAVCAELLLHGAQRHDHEGLPWSLAAAPAIDAALVGVLLWILYSRAQLVPAMVLAVAGGLGCVAYDLAVTLTGRQLALAGQSVQALGVVTTMLFGLAALHPSMTALGDAGALRHSRRPSSQLLLLVPTALVPLAMLSAHALGRGVRSPTWALVAASVLVMLAVLVRAVSVLRSAEHNAEQDPLTGLLNRRGLARAFARTTSRQRGLVRRRHGSSPPPALPPLVIWIDLDDFKRINDRHGHSSGDAVLVATARRLRAAVGRRGVVARQGGDEFIVVLHPSRRVSAETVHRAVERELGPPIDAGGHLVSITASVGVVEVAPGEDLERVLADADIAMYAAKGSGGSTARVFEVPMRERAVASAALVEDLHALLDDVPLRSGDLAGTQAGEQAGEQAGTRAGTRAGDLVVLYQPMVELVTGRVVGAEALVRWQHPVRGLIGPDQFLPLAEREGLGAAVDEVVLHRALTQLRRWNDRTPDGGHVGSGWTLSVNLGLSSTCDPALPRRVREALATHDVPACRLHLEITEHEALPEDEQTRARLHELAGTGVSLSLDDFGVGYTSLSYLRRYPIGVLKLDRSLITPDDATSSALRAGIVALAGTLGVQVVAEGIEHAGQAEELRELGVHLGQGYHFSPPLPAEAFTTFLSTSGTRYASAPPPAALIRSSA